MEKVYIGIDIGSISVKYAVLGSNKNVIDTLYRRHFGLPYKLTIELLKSLYKKYGKSNIMNAAFTGSGSREFLKDFKKIPINEVVAAAKAVNFLYPKIRTVVELGGEDSKFLLLNENDSESVLKDFAMNSICAAGTGSFLDQQASRLNVSIENEFGELALKSENPPRIAGRCSVFAKTDMIHLQQRGTPDYDIVAGLCYAVARNFKSNIAKSKNFIKPIAFIGGVANNRGMIKAFEEILGLQDGELVIPEYFDCLGAVGAVLEDEKYSDYSVPDLASFNKNGDVRDIVFSLPPLEIKKSEIHKGDVVTIKENEIELNAFLGIDVGSVSTNLAVIDEQGNVVSKRYLDTAGRPIEAVKTGLREIGREVGEQVNICGVCTTGSGRYMLGDFVGADIVKNEITAQATGALQFDKTVDTIFEIGGQDSKYISIDNGVIVDFEMNKVCAAGTGSFLEEQAEKLDIKIKEEFQDIAINCQTPCKFGERCTVFIESDLISHQQKGASKNELVSGLAYSIVQNYLNKVVGKRRIGNNIFFQGGTACNKAVVAAFEKKLDKKITVPPHNDVTGAIGAALITRENYEGEKSRFKGFDLHKRKYELKTFTCNGCANVCEINQVKIENEKPLYYGHRCEKYDIEEKSKRPDYIVDVFEKREKLLLGKYYDNNLIKSEKSGKIQIGIPRIVHFYENFPFWRTFFEELGFEIILSSQTNTKLLRIGTEEVTGEFCFPIKAVLGHIYDLIEKGVKNIFLPSIINLKKEHPNFTQSYVCPYVQSIPYSVKSNINADKYDINFIEPHLKFIHGNEAVTKELYKALKKFGIKINQIKKALEKAEYEQDSFNSQVLEIGEEVLKNNENKKTVVIIGRPYNTCDKGLNLNIPAKLMDMGIQVLPIDAVPIEYKNLVKYHRNMYWRYGQKILATGEVIRKNENLFSIYITNFGCGPDSMIFHYYSDIMQGKPYLQLEIDEHSGDAGIITRCEAFFDSLEGFSDKKTREMPATIFSEHQLNGRKLYLPYMSDHAFSLEGVFNSFGIETEVLNETTEESADIGRKFTTGKECYPCITTMGDFISKIQSEDFQPDKSAFFFATAHGPCRFGQYQSIHNLAFREIGFDNIPIISLTSNDSYSGHNEFDKSFRRKGWWAVAGTDVLIKMLHQTRPYEVNKGETERKYRESIEMFSNALRSNQDPFKAIEVCAEKMRTVKIDHSLKLPSVGMVGEIYLRQNAFSNSYLINKLEDLNLEVWLSPLAEWIYYTNQRFIEDSEEEKNIKRKFKGLLIEWFQKRDEERLVKPFERHLRYAHDSDIKKVLKFAEPYIDKSFGGEAILSIGKGLDFIKTGANGIINVMPFSCMPGTVTPAISKKIKDDYNNVPWLNVSFDGQQDDVNLKTRLEAFAFQVKSFKNEFCEKV